MIEFFEHEYVLPLLSPSDAIGRVGVLEGARREADAAGEPDEHAAREDHARHAQGRPVQDPQGEPRHCACSVIVVIN